MSSSMSSYKESVSYLYGLERLGIKPGLDRTRTLLHNLGDPQRDFPSVIIAGTNGKGSTSAMIERVMREAGFRTGLYTSPHLECINERIRVSGRSVSDRRFVTLVDSVRRAGSEELGATFFEFMTAMAMVHFKESAVDFAIIEVGLGGRLDATNVIDPVTTVITSVALDHSAILGSSLKRVAFQKAGVIKAGVPVVTAVADDAPLRVIEKTAMEKSAPLFILRRDFRMVHSRGALVYKGSALTVGGIELPLRGEHQVSNAATAVAAASALRGAGFDIPVSAIREGIRKVKWPGRFEVVSRRPRLILDCAHNPHAARALAAALSGGGALPRRGRGRGRLIVVLGIMATKDASGFLSVLSPLVHLLVATKPSVKNSTPVEELLVKGTSLGLKVMGRQTVAGALRAALREARPEDTVCVTGSVYTVGEAKAALSKGVAP